MSSGETCPTVRVKSPDAPGGFVIFNESDFVDGMELYEEPKPADPRDDLVKQAGELGIKVDGRWSNDRLKSEIDAALKA
ncbi:hypothetical protein [Bosea sp. AS-1]|uniref:hypothetical protein n=1 Tax=Bosea sp. AS-1 TaxID=2015316 RepID=UPI000B775C82|nr:hypothetical protein [Bosea sp. AS-1]